VIDDGCETDRRTDRIGSTTEVETTDATDGRCLELEGVFRFSFIN